MIDGGVKYRWLRVGETIESEDQYYDPADKSFQPTTNAGHDVNHAKMYRHPLRFQRPVGCLDWATCLSS